MKKGFTLSGVQNKANKLGKLRRRFLSPKGFTLLEMMLVVLIFTFLFSAILVVLAVSDRSWRTGQHKGAEQQEARRVMDNIVRLLRQSKPEWVTIAPSGWSGRDKILFYEPIFNETTGEMTPGPWIIFKPDTNNARLLIKKKEGEDWVPLAQEIEKIKFYGGDCVGCNCNFANPGCSTCLSVTDNCPLVKIEIETKKENGFVLLSYVNLRNISPGGGGEIPEPPAEGEF